MPYRGNNERMIPQNPFASTGNLMFMPQQQPGPGLAGMLAPQAGNRPLANDALSADGPFSGISSLQDLATYGPAPTLPYVPPPTAPIIQQMQALQGQYSQTALPLLAQLLGLEQSLGGTYEQYFGPEMALRNELLNILSGQNNDALEALLGLQEQYERPRGSTTFFKGF